MPAIINFDSFPRKSTSGWHSSTFPRYISCAEIKYPANVSETQGNKRFLQSDRQTNTNNIFTFRQLNKIGEKVNGISGTKNYLIVRKGNLGLKLKINVCTFSFWVSYAPEKVASYQEDNSFRPESQ